MRIKVSFSELTDFYATFEERIETLNVEFAEVSVRYVGDLPDYSGTYSVTPKTEIQTLKTAQKTLRNDIKVFAIPYAEVSNKSGGITATIGG